MVKIEDSTQNNIVSSSGNNVIIPKIEPSNDHILKEEFGSSSSNKNNNNNNLRSYFIEMGFNPNNVDIVLKQNGRNNNNNNGEIILNELQALENPQRAESSISLDQLFNSDNEEQEEEESKPNMSYIEKRSSLLSMNFSEEQIESAFEQIGEYAPIEEFIDFICNFQNQNDNEIKPSFLNTEVNNNNNENLLKISETSLLLLNRGFTENEVSNAIHIFGNQKSVTEIAELIMENRMRFNHDDDSKENVIRSQNQESKIRFNPSTSNSSFSTPNQENQENQEAKTNPTFHYQNSFLTPNPVFQNPVFPNHPDSSHPNKKLKKPIFPLEDETNKIALNSTPYFIYGNVIPVSEEIWNRLSRFLFNIEPEFLNSQFFSCLNRKEGFFHNLPPHKRQYLIPKSSDNIESALPFTKEFWPNWDLRTKFNHNIFNHNNEICNKLEIIVKNSENFTNEKKKYVMEKLEEFNLIWIGDKKLGFLDSNQLERVMGYPFEHTRLSDPFERLKIMKNCFQTDTIGYILSPLKYLFPDGIRVLSIYTGIGGAEIALNRLGVRIKCLVSVDSSEIHRKVIKNWWHNCNNNEYGELRQIDGVSKVTSFKIGELIREFGGFDLIIGNWMDWNSFFEFLRILRIINGS